jgi:hypothetical protein
MMNERDDLLVGEDVGLPETTSGETMTTDGTESSVEGDDLTAEVEPPGVDTPKVENLLKAVSDMFPDYELTGDNLNGWVVEALRQYRNADMRIDEVLSLNPEFAEILKRVYEGEDAVVAMASVFSPEEYADMVENGGAKAKEARDGRVKHLKEIREWENTRSRNLGVSEQTVRQYQSETGRSDDEMMRILDTMGEINNALNDGRVSKRELAMIDKLINADSNALAEEKADTVANRNERIDARKAAEFSPKGDGLPKVGPSGAVPKDDPLSGTFLGGLGTMASVWDRR